MGMSVRVARRMQTELLQRRSAAVRLLVALELAALIVLGGVTVLRFHVWADIDERPHYDYIQKVAERQRLPRPTDLVSPEVQAITDRTWPLPSPTDRASIGLAGRSYEAIQPPLYYVAAAPSFSAVGDHHQKVYAVRAFDLALLLSAVFLLWRLARRLASRRDEALLALAVALPVLLWPGVVVRAVTLGNTSLELVLATAFMVVLWRADCEGRGSLMAGAAALLGLCLLTKLSLLCLVPLFLLVLVRRLRRPGTRGSRAATVAWAALPALMLAPWLVLNLTRYGSPTVGITGAQGIVAPIDSAGFADRLGALPGLNWRLLDGVLPQEWVAQLDVWWVRAGVDGLGIALLVGAVALLVACRGEWRTWFLATPFVAGVLLMNTTYVLTGNDAFLLRYIYPTLGPLALGVGLALARPGMPGSRGVAGTAALLLVVALLWVDMAGAFYFTDVGRRLGI